MCAGGVLLRPHLARTAKDSVKLIVSSDGDCGSAKTKAPPIAVADPATAAFRTGDHRRIEEGIASVQQRMRERQRRDNVPHESSQCQCLPRFLEVLINREPECGLSVAMPRCAATVAVVLTGAHALLRLLIRARLQTPRAAARSPSPSISYLIAA